MTKKQTSIKQIFLSSGTRTNIRQRFATGNEVQNIGRIKRSLKLIIYLSDWRTIKQCAKHIEVSDRSIQRYFKMLINLGFIMETNHYWGATHRITNVKEYFNIK